MSVAGVASADTKVKLRQTSGGQTYENTSYIKGKRQRSETNNGQMIMLQQCDLRRNIQIMPQAQAYIIQPYDVPATSNAGTTTSSTSQPGAVRKGGVVTSTVTTKDTGERKQIFGFTARHIITTMVMDSTPDACSPVKNKMEIDGWYIDATFAYECDSQRTYTPYKPQANGGCQDRYETKQIGTAKKGFAVWEKTTMFDPNGGESFSTINEVVEFSHATLDQSLFDIPAGYREVKDFASAMMANAGATETGNPSSPDTNVSSNPNTVATQPNNAATTEIGPKRPGVLRFGIVTVRSGNVGEAMNGPALALAVQNTLTKSLQTQNVEVVAIQGAGSAIQTEAQQKECDFVVFTDVGHKKGGGGFGSFLGSSASTIAGNVGYGGGTAAVVAANVATATVAESIKAKDELTLDVRLERPSRTPVFGKQYKGKAKSGGEDIITPLVEQAAQGIVEAAKR